MSKKFPFLLLFPEPPNTGNSNYVDLLFRIAEFEYKILDLPFSLCGFISAFLSRLPFYQQTCPSLFFP